MLLLPHPGQSEEGVELVVDGLEPHLNLAVVLPVLRAILLVHLTDKVDEELKIQLPYTICGESYFHFLFAFVMDFCIPF